MTHEALRTLLPIAGWGEERARAVEITGGSDPILPTWLMDNQQASLMRLIFMGLALMLLMIFRPQGIFGDRRELAIDAR